MSKFVFILLSFSLLTRAQEQQFLMDQASGTSMNPEAAPMAMAMRMRGPWMLMFMGQAFVVDTQQSGPRGADKFYSVNYGMFSASRKLGRGTFLFETMLSLDPATVTQRRYPELFQTGETAFGKPLVDAQHPHDFIMGLGVQYAYPVSENTLLQVYFAPVGDPALGPVAFPHRASAEELPQATLTHHWQDSTHVANEVLTVGLKYKKVRLEGSGFYGTEPNENRWNIDHGPMNSWSVRASVFPTSNWMAQVSVGHLTRPERQEVGDVLRTTASVHYSRPMEGGNWSTSLIWGRNHKVLDGRNSDGYLLESVLPIRKRNFLTGRVEVVDKDELFAAGGPAYRISAFTAGYTRDIWVSHNMETGIGANVTAYGVPSAIQSAYGGHPMGVNVFLRVRLKPGS